MRITPVAFRSTILLALISISFAGAGTTKAEPDDLQSFFRNLFQLDQPATPETSIKYSEAAFINVAAEDRLLRAIGHYQAISDKGGWSPITEGTPLKIDDIGPRVVQVRNRLQLTGDLVPTIKGQRDVFDGNLENAIKRFQVRHGLMATGEVNRQMLQAMNVTAQNRLSQLKVNLERLRNYVAKTQGSRSVFVNIPAFHLQAVHNGKVGLSSRVVVGRTDRRTPALDAKIVAVNFLPTWRVPDGITNRDLIPKLKKDPDYFTRENFRILRVNDGVEISPRTINWNSPEATAFKFQQLPGANNALGLIRIDMPNKHTVYLHDTPLKKLFDRPSRAFSSGCVRVQKIADLATWLLATEPGWGPQEVHQRLQSKQSLNVSLKDHVPVHFIYLTSWVEPNGTVNFREDIYRLDGTSLRAQHYIEREQPIQPVTP